jgi:N-acetylglucosaminyldiphosphoundecaprenol N-acetyl-beta-D-mannosaminyltransferase
VYLPFFNKAMLIQNLVERQKQESSSHTLTRAEMPESSVSGKSLDRGLSSIFYRKVLNHLNKFISVVNVRSFIKTGNSESCLMRRATGQVILEHPAIDKAFRAKYPQVSSSAVDMELFLSVCDVATTEKVSILLLGSQPALLRKVKSKLEHDFPNIQILDAIPLAFYPSSDREIKSLVQRINSSGAGIVFVSLGCRHQALWMAQQHCVVQSVMIGLGSVFPRYVGLGRESLH